MLQTVLLVLLFDLSRGEQTTTSLTTLPTSPAEHVNVSIQRQDPSHLLPVAHSFLRGITQDLPSLPFTNEWPSSSAAFERPLSKVDLLALKVDQSLMSSLDRWLAKYGITMPQSVLKTIDEMDLCPERASDGMIRKYVT